MGQVLYRGDGTRRAAAALPAGIRTIAGTGAAGGVGSPIVDEIPATKALADFVRGAVVGPDGSVYIAHRDRIRKVTPDGIIHTIAGGPRGRLHGRRRPGEERQALRS